MIEGIRAVMDESHAGKVLFISEFIAFISRTCALESAPDMEICSLTGETNITGKRDGRLAFGKRNMDSGRASTKLSLKRLKFD